MLEEVPQLIAQKMKQNIHPEELVLISSPLVIWATDNYTTTCPSPVYLLNTTHAIH